MARITDDGHIKSPPPGMVGLHIAWADLGAWVGPELKDRRKRLILVRKGNPGGGGQDHSEEWHNGYQLAVHNALVRLRDAFGVKSDAKLKPRPEYGTAKRNGYDAGVAAVQLAIADV